MQSIYSRTLVDVEVSLGVVIVWMTCNHVFDRDYFRLAFSVENTLCSPLCISSLAVVS